MQHFHSLEEVFLQNVWLTIGSFDGVHRGHQAIVKQLTAGADAMGVPAIVLTFFPHPAVVVRNRVGPFYLTSPEQRASILGDLGVGAVITQTFDQQVALTSAQDFMRRIHRHLQPSHLLVGPDFALGHGRQGNIEELRRMGDDFNFTLSIFDPVINDDEVISSSRIRSALAEGDMVKAQNLLGRPYRIDGAVIPGDRRGRSLGIPTANLDVWAERALPKTGVYACYAHVEDQTLLAVVNIGTRPTFDTQNKKQHVEAHLLHFNGNLYGKQLELDFITRIRNEQRFSSIEALVDQIHQDIHTAETLL